MAYLNTKTKKVVTPFDIRVENPTISFPNGPWSNELLSSLGYAELKYPSEYTQPGLYEKLVEGEPEKIGNEWFKSIRIVALSEEEKKAIITQKWMELRQSRNFLLSNCDWTQLDDAPITNKTEWAKYRQALRDITNVDDPHNVVWPQPPA